MISRIIRKDAYYTSDKTFEWDGSRERRLGRFGAKLGYRTLLSLDRKGFAIGKFASKIEARSSLRIHEWPRASYGGSYRERVRSPINPHNLTSMMAAKRLSQIQNHISSPSDLASTLYSSDRHVVTITINNAARANCLSTAVLKALLAAFTSINPKITLDSSIDSEDPIVFAERVCRSHSPNPVPKVVLLKSVGKIFSSGHDLREFHAANGDYKAIHDIFELCNRLMLTIQRLPQVVISQVFPPFDGGSGDIGRFKGLQRQQEHN